MAQYFVIHPTHPQARLIARAAEIVRTGGVIAYPTDSCYALGCHVGDKSAMERLRRIRGVDERHHFTLMCRDLSEIGTYRARRQRAVPAARTLPPVSPSFSRARRTCRAAS
jgi:tRNA A37 threonylcarbamoyladenosine synthetase subunit TsaC/SUA5/YrdC